MRGRPKKENARDIVYKVRLNDEEDRMLTRASEWTSQAKSEVFRKALQVYYKSVELNEHLAIKILRNRDGRWIISVSKG